jgi:type VI secretion system secreted protein Hcp
MYLKLATVPGEAVGKGYEQTIAVHSFSFGASNPVSISSSSGGAGASLVQVSTMNIMKEADASSPVLFGAVCKGAHYDNATLFVLEAGGDANVYLQYDMTLVFVDNVQWSGSGGGGKASESISLAFGSIKATYFKQDATGKTSKAAEFGWNVQTHAPL